MPSYQIWYRDTEVTDGKWIPATISSHRDALAEEARGMQESMPFSDIQIMQTPYSETEQRFIQVQPAD